MGFERPIERVPEDVSKTETTLERLLRENKEKEKEKAKEATSPRFVGDDKGNLIDKKKSK